MILQVQESQDVPISQAKLADDNVVGSGGVPGPRFPDYGLLPPISLQKPEVSDLQNRSCDLQA